MICTGRPSILSLPGTFSMALRTSRYWGVANVPDNGSSTPILIGPVPDEPAVVVPVVPLGGVGEAVLDGAGLGPAHVGGDEAVVARRREGVIGPEGTLVGVRLDPLGQRRTVGAVRRLDGGLEDVEPIGTGRHRVQTAGGEG